MERRLALKNLSAAFGGLITLPAWANNWTPESLGISNSISANDSSLLAEIVETIIPETKTPGAKSLKVHQFTMRMIDDCFGEKAQNLMQQGFINTNAIAQKLYNKHFEACDKTQKMNAIIQLRDSDENSKQFTTLVKRLTIQGYTNSEYYMTHVLKYTMAPGFYHGCVPIS